MTPLYAIVDIETTGGQTANGSITEIAILIHDGNKVIDRYETLVQPASYIPKFITDLTGIDNEMVANSPTFESIAQDVYDFLQGKIFVAHNVNFDYSFVKQHLKNAGIDYISAKLCTVRLSRKIFPGFSSYSLGKLCAQLGIELNNQHRAGGDAEATAELFSLLLENDKHNFIEIDHKPKAGEQTFPPNLEKSVIDHLPNSTGVYFFHDEKGKVIYIGKAIDIQKRVKSHFSGNKITKQRQDFLREVCSISFELCPNELFALVTEAVEIKKTWPKHNRAIKQFEPKFGIFKYQDQNDFYRLIIGKYNKSLLPVLTFHDSISARNCLIKLVNEHALCSELNKTGDCLVCKDETNNLHRNPTKYNVLFEKALESLTASKAPYFIKEKGRDEDETAVIWVEPGRFYAMGYLANDLQPSNPEEIKELLKPIEATYYLSQLIQKYGESHPWKITYLEKGEWNVR